MNKKPASLGPIVFFGNERLATGVKTDASTLQGLLDRGYDVAAVVSSYEKGTSRNARGLEIADVAAKHNIPLLLPDKLSDIQEELKALSAQLGVLVAYGKIVPQSVIDMFPHGIINIHPSLLPLHRGPIPIEGAILEGASRTGVSIMRLTQELDSGPVYGQSEVVLSGTETKQELADTLLEIGQAMLLELLPEIVNGSVIAVPQDDNQATYDARLVKDDGVIDWSKPAVQIEREVRAYAGWPKSRTKLAGKDVIITEARAMAGESLDSNPGAVAVLSETKILAVATGRGSLWIERLKPAGKNEMAAQEFLAGHWDLFI